MTKSVSSNHIDYLKRVAKLILFTFLSNSIAGQEIWSSDRFLDFETDQLGLPFEENLNFLDTKVKGMPFVDNYEFRTESDRMDIEQQRFQFRFKFNSKDERKAYDKILGASRDRYSWLQAQYELELWEDKYSNVIDLYFLQKELELVRQESELLTDKKTVLKKLMDSKAEINVENWIGNENEIFNARLDSIELEIQKKEISQKIFGSERTLPKLDDTNFIQIETLRKRVSNLMDSKQLYPEEEIAQVERNLADAEYQLEVAEGEKWLNFAQIEYQADDNVSFQREISLGTSITLPSKGNNRIKKNDAVLKLLERNYKLKLKEDEHTKELRQEEAKLLNLIGQLEDFKQLRKDQKLEFILKDFSDKKIVSPLVLIGIKRSMVKDAKKQLNIEKDIFETYINFLTLKAAFIAQPKINYLSE